MRHSSAHRAVLCAALITAAGLCGCDTAERSRAQALRRGTTVEIATLDPHFFVRPEEAPVLMDLHEGLVRLDARGNVVPAVAETWSASEDGREYSFVLRDDARWSDGTPLTATDFVWSFRRLADPATLSPHAGKLAAVTNASSIAAGELAADALGVTAVDARTLRIVLEAPAPSFLPVLAHAALAPVHAASVERYDPLPARSGPLISNGPYVLLHRAADRRLVELGRNSSYWAAERIGIERVRYVAFEDELAQFTAYRVAEIDVTDGVPVSGAEIVRDQFPGELHARPAKDTFYYVFNLREGPLADSAALREALSAAIRREAVTAEVMQLGEAAAYSLVPPAFAGYEPARLAFAGVDSAAREAAARKRLELMVAMPPRLRVVYDSSDEAGRVAAAVAAMWRQALGVEASLTERNYAALLDVLKDPAAWDVARIPSDEKHDDPQAFLDVFASGSPSNFAGFSDPAYDDLLERARREPSPSRRLVLLREAEQRLLDASAVAPVFFRARRILVKPWVEVRERAPVKPLRTADLRWAEDEEGL